MTVKNHRRIALHAPLVLSTKLRPVVQLVLGAYRELYQLRNVKRPEAAIW